MPGHDIIRVSGFSTGTLEAIRYTNIGTVKTTVFWHETRLFCPDQITNPLFQGRHIVCVCMYAG